ncbi:uncharacterized protein Z518_00684 [Rhinocladiella mackenziei CBS 650.93]|uniref:Uncharacterized protein n=1 Tax=Rhinocladiella mackenziei CBS 650.93 TaxID=1442369 RepID=A0A0D2IU68_9EURO|nr:uncharacterized protein Z518_00684 [Rhinocladiella mackenziei CBS 650.93]KIX09604.1 hypothetical protein Z518_00684 [Rhinocladiella mackenziei CBS 650.93]
MSLKHRGVALNELRSSLSAPDRHCSGLILLTMSTLLTLNYMINDLEAFKVHLHALETMRRSCDADEGDELFIFFYPGHPFPPDLCTVIAKLPEGFAEVALGGSIAVEFISFLVKLTELIGWMSRSLDERLLLPRPEMTLQRAIYDLQCLSALPLIPMESRMLQRCLLWCSIVLASAWDKQIDASPENHVVLDRLVDRMPEARSWEDTEETMRKFMWDDRLSDEWEVCWRAAAFRTRRQRRRASQMAPLSQLLMESSQNSSSVATLRDWYRESPAENVREKDTKTVEPSAPQACNAKFDLRSAPTRYLAMLGEQEGH